MYSPMVQYRGVRSAQPQMTYGMQPVRMAQHPIAYGPPRLAPVARGTPAQPLRAEVIRSPTPAHRVVRQFHPVDVLATPALVHREYRPSEIPQPLAYRPPELPQAPAYRPLEMPQTPTLVHREVIRTPAMQHREVVRTPAVQHREVLRTPAVEHREVLRTPALQHREVMRTPNIQHREVCVTADVQRIVQALASPALPCRSVRPSEAVPIPALSSSYPPQAAQTAPPAPAGTGPVRQLTGTNAVAVPAPRPSTVTAQEAAVQATVAAGGQVVWLAAPAAVPAQPQLAAAGHPVNAVMSEGQAAMERIRSAVDFLPHTPPNALLDWLKYILSGQTEPGEPRPDGGKYWDKRRVQTSLRRLLESIQDWSEKRQEQLTRQGADAPSGDLAGEVLCGIWQATPGQGLGTLDPEKIKMTEQDFITGVQLLGAWPPELTPGDRQEVFAALLVPTQRSIRHLKEGRANLSQVLNLRSLREGLSGIPYVLPDFPVPVHLLQGSKSASWKISEIAKELATRFAADGTGADMVKDFYLSGLLSLEELQIALPELVEIRKLEQAVELILRTSSRCLTAAEWQKFVYSVRGEHPGAKEEEATPKPPAEADTDPGPDSGPQPGQKHFLEELGVRQVVDWSTTGGRRHSHQADEGAGVQVEKPSFLTDKAPEPGDEGIRLISLDWHNECLGPLLAAPFVRCCQIYKAISCES